MEAENRTKKEVVDAGTDMGTFQHVKDVRETLERLYNNLQSTSFAGSKSFDERMEDLGVQEKESTIKWRARFSIFMMVFLVIQYGVVIFFLLLQGFNWWGFNSLDNRIFYILIGGTLVQSYFLVRIIFQHLFPMKK